MFSSSYQCLAMPQKLEEHETNVALYNATQHRNSALALSGCCDKLQIPNFLTTWLQEHDSPLYEMEVETKEVISFLGSVSVLSEVLFVVLPQLWSQPPFFLKPNLGVASWVQRRCIIALTEV